MSTVHSVVKKYQEILSANLKFAFSNSRPTLGKVGEANRLFVFQLCSDRQLLIEFLKDTGLINSELQCDKCKAPMKFRSHNSLSDGFIWLCEKKYNGKKCANKKSIRKGSWFNYSRLKLEEIFLLTYEIVRGTKTTHIETEYFFSSHTLTYWRKLINEKILDFVEYECEKVGGSGKIVEVGISSLGKSKHIEGNLVKSQWVFGGVERISGKLFLAAIIDKNPKMLVGLIKKWVKQGTTIYIDGGPSHISLGSEEFNDLSLNYNITYSDAECHTNTIKCIWRHIENTFPSYNRQLDFKYYIYNYLFKKCCDRKKIDCFNAFLECITNVNQEEENTDNFSTFLELTTKVKQED